METPTSNIITTGDLGGHKIAMGFDESAMSHIMGILTDMYSDAELACIREYSTNALDSHIEAGNTEPIRVFTPNAMSPYFKVQDYGVGLSKSDIETMYSKYGASTKRGTNDQVGMLGIGAKSALSLVPQFSITSVKNGMRIVVSVSRNAEGAGQMEILSEQPTSERNGVEISIPIPRSSNFAEKCRHFFRFWKEGTVLVDGKAPEHITGRPVGERFIVNHNLERDYIVMGNVAYPCKESLYEYGYNYRQLGIVAFVNIGDVNFTPSREELQYTPKTKATIQSLQAEFTAQLVTAAQKDVEDAPSHAEAWTRSRQWKSTFYNRLGEFRYKGTVVPSDISFDLDDKSTYGNSVINGRQFSLTGRNGRYATWVRSVNPTMLDSHLFVTGFADSLKPSPTQKEKISIYLTQKGWSCTQFVLFTQDTFVSKNLDFVKDIKIVKWEDIAKIKVVRAKSAGGIKRTDPYDLYTGNYSYQTTSEIDTSKQIIYISPAEDRQPSHLRTIFPDAQIVMLGMNRWDKFKRDFPMAKRHGDAIAEEHSKLIAQFTRTDKILWSHDDNYSKRTFTMLKGRDIADPDLREFVEVLTDKTELSPAAKKLRAFPRGYNSASVEAIESPLTKYPLAGNLTYTNTDHAVWYLNAYYNHLNSKEN